MNILVIGGTRYMGIHLVRELLQMGYHVTIATRGIEKDTFGEKIQRIVIERTSLESLTNAFQNKSFDVVYDNLAYCSKDVKYLLESVKCKKYIMVSSASVYNKHLNIKEDDFNPDKYDLKWCSRSDYPYDEIKRQAESALFQTYSSQDAIAVRYPFVIGKDDYTKRLLFYVEHIVKEVPMYIDNLNNQLGFIRSDEAGKFLAFLVDKNYHGAINGSSIGTISLIEIINYVEKKTGKKAILCENGEVAPYNGEMEYSINTDHALKLGFCFSELDQWIYDLIDMYLKGNQVDNLDSHF